MPNHVNWWIVQSFTVDLDLDNKLNSKFLIIRPIELTWTLADIANRVHVEQLTLIYILSSHIVWIF